MKKLLIILMAMPLLMMSCNDEIAVNEEAVEVNFTAELEGVANTRANGESTLSVNKVVCAVFDTNGNEISGLRQTITDMNQLTYSPRLIKGRTYQVVFWAMKDANYDVTNLTAISRSTTPANEEDYDAFTATIQTTVTNSTSVPVTLTRPIAQLNMGVTPDDWDACESTFNMIPSNITISLTGKDTFNALTGSATGENKPISYNLSVSGNEFTVDGNTYKNIAMCYVLTDANKENFDITYSINDQNDDAIRSNVVINAVPLQANYKTNVVGGLLTGTVTYNVSISEGFTAENNKSIE